MQLNSHVLMALGRHDGGSLIENADEALTKIVRDVVRYGGKGKLTITLEVCSNSERAIKLKAAVKSTAPQPPQGEAFYWADSDDHLTRTPPKDEYLLLRAIPSGVAKA